MSFPNAQTQIGGLLGELLQQLYGVADGLTALAGGAQAGTALKAGINRFTTIATTADSAQLPANNPYGTNLPVVVINATASGSSTALAVFGQTGDAINAIAANSAFSVAGNKIAIFVRTSPTQWHSILTA